MTRILLAIGTEVRYDGPATLGGYGRARLHDRVGGIDEMLWEALDGAEWVGEVATRRWRQNRRDHLAPALAT